MFNKKESFNAPAIVNPRKAWTIIIFIALLILVCGIVCDYLFYRFVFNQSIYIEVPTEEINIERLNIDNIDKTIKNFDNKIKSTSDLKKTILIDPAL